MLASRTEVKKEKSLLKGEHRNSFIHISSIIESPHHWNPSVSLFCYSSSLLLSSTPILIRLVQIWEVRVSFFIKNPQLRYHISSCRWRFKMSRTGLGNVRRWGGHMGIPNSSEHCLFLSHLIFSVFKFSTLFNYQAFIHFRHSSSLKLLSESGPSRSCYTRISGGREAVGLACITITQIPKPWYFIFSRSRHGSHSVNKGIIRTLLYRILSGGKWFLWGGQLAELESMRSRVWRRLRRA